MNIQESVKFSDRIEDEASPVKNFIERHAFFKTAGKVGLFGPYLIFKLAMTVAKFVMRTFSPRFEVVNEPLNEPKSFDQIVELYKDGKKEDGTVAANKVGREISAMVAFYNKKGGLDLEEFKKKLSEKYGQTTKRGFESFVKNECQKVSDLQSIASLEKDNLEKLKTLKDKGINCYDDYSSRVEGEKKRRRGDAGYLKFLRSQSQTFDKKIGEENYKELRKRIDKTHDHQEVPGDGHCQFYSVLFGCDPEAVKNYTDWQNKSTGSKGRKTEQLFFKRAMEMRDKLLESMCEYNKRVENESVLDEFIIDGDYRVNYENMSKKSESVGTDSYGQVWTAKLLAIALKRPIHIIDQGTGEVTYCNLDFESNKLPGEPIHILKTLGAHYEAFVPKEKKS